MNVPQIEATALPGRQMSVRLEGYGPGWPSLLQTGYQETVKWYFHLRHNLKVETTVSRVNRTINLNGSECFEVEVFSDHYKQRQQLEYFCREADGVYWVLSIVSPEPGKPLEVVERSTEPPSPRELSSYAEHPLEKLEVVQLGLNGKTHTSLRLRAFPDPGEEIENLFISEEYYNAEGFCLLFRRYLPEESEHINEIRFNPALEYAGRQYYLYYDGVLQEKA